ncbi:hypothetical protein TcWFU_003356 [Taenia crassiceps]|uniref:Homeobox domain-containing protein n=1 Tax=Taenia crassiceps TaxID=6207 RepID=A0ABR4QQ46_9CEST
MAGGESDSNHKNVLHMETPHVFYPTNSSIKQPAFHTPTNSLNPFTEVLVQSPPINQLPRGLAVCEDGSNSEDVGQFSISSSSGSAEQSSGLPLPPPPPPPPPSLQIEGGEASSGAAIFTPLGDPTHLHPSGGLLEAPPFHFQSSITSMQPETSALWGYYSPSPSQPLPPSQCSQFFFPGCPPYLPTSQPLSQQVARMPLQRPELHQPPSHVNSRTFSVDRTRIFDGCKGDEEGGEVEMGADNGRGSGSVGRRKNVTRESTSTLKTWLRGHMHNPYPTKGEKVMLAIITKMTITQVSTWFANARRRLKKENKMTWLPSTRSEGETKQSPSSQPSSSNVVVTGTPPEKVQQEEEVEVGESGDENHDTSLFGFHSDVHPPWNSFDPNWQQNYSNVHVRRSLPPDLSPIRKAVKQGKSPFDASRHLWFA